MDRSLYDEFGNYIGPETEGEEVEDEGDLDFEESLLRARQEELDAHRAAIDASEPGSLSATTGLISMLDVGVRAVVPHEEKEYYPDAKEVYGDAEVVVQEEDTQPLTQPIIAPVKTKNFDILEKEPPETTFSFDFLSGLMYKPALIRNVVVLGHLHHGKSLFMDVLVEETHIKDWHVTKECRYTDSRVDEQSRGLSVKATPLSLVLPDPREKSYLLNIMDTPGHVNFSDEATAAMRLADGALIVVDALEGVMTNTERLLRHAVRERLDICLVLNCIDRVILELRIPPADAYHKLRHTIEEVNAVLEEESKTLGFETRLRVSPALGNVAFASAQLGNVFTLQSFARIYASLHGDSFEPEHFAKCLWGDWYFDAEKRTFTNAQPEGPNAPQRSFVQFVLEPLYKICAHTVSEEQPALEPTLRELGIFLRREDFRLTTRSLLKRVWKRFFGDASALVEMVANFVRSPLESAPTKVAHIYSGDQNGPVAGSMARLDTSGPLMAHTTKMYHRPDCSMFDAFGRVLSGTLAKGMRVKVLGEAFTLDDSEDSATREITHLWVYEGRYRVEVSHVPAGNWVLIGGVDVTISKTSTIASLADVAGGMVEIFRPLRFDTQNVIKVATEPLNPSELPKMLEAMRKIEKSYPLAQTRVEESGEHIILGTGELYMDCVLHDLRKLYGDIELKVSDPGVPFCETVVETSAMKCFAETPNKKNKLHMIVQPLEKGLGSDIERGLVRSDWPKKQLSQYLTTKYDWDVLAARSIWGFGPDDKGSNVLLDDSIAGEVDKALLSSVRDHVTQGFQWAAREGPLVEEPMRNCKFRILDATFSDEHASRGAGQIIPTARRACYSSFLLATPRLMEPLLLAEIQCPADCVGAVYTVLSRRRGHVARDVPKPGTPLYIVHAYLPAIESFGFETDLRIHTSGQAFGATTFDSWTFVPGDPLDRSITLRPLEPAPAPHLAREFLLKTRRRKGLSEDVSVRKFFDDPMLAELAEF